MYKFQTKLGYNERAITSAQKIKQTSGDARSIKREQIRNKLREQLKKIR